MGVNHKKYQKYDNLLLFITYNGIMYYLPGVLINIVLSDFNI
jgi:hypothetical protein